MAAKVFISHSSRDHNKAMALVQKLEVLDLTCWIAPRDIRPGQIWASSIMEGIASADALLVLCSEHVLEFDQVLREIERAAARHIPIVPARLSNITLVGALEYFLSDAQWIDLFPEEVGRYASAIEAAIAGRPAPPVQLEENTVAPVMPDDWGRKRSFLSRLSRFLDDKE